MKIKLISYIGINSTTLYNVTLPDGSDMVMNVPDGTVNHEEYIAAKAVEELVQSGMQQYQAKRLLEYPSVGDQLDALWKGGADADDMKAKVNAVKAKHAKN